MTIKKVSALLMLLTLLLSACSGGNTPNTPATNNPGTNSGSTASSGGDTTTGGSEQAADEITGEITFIHQRTDINDSVFKADYAKRFNEKYPKVTVKFEAITDYEGQIKIRMNTTDYGDVLLIPNDIPAEDLPHFFEPLGSMEELSKTYRFMDERAFEGITYGIPITVNAQGILYNKKVFEAAGITSIPTSTDAYVEAMKQIKEKTDAIPYYTNYAAGWTLSQWENARLNVAGDPDYVNFTMVNEGDPFLPGKPHYILYKLMYDLANQGLIEKDPTTTDWESSKVMLAEGKIASMLLGSWAITQVQELAADPNDIGYMPFPHQVNGKVYATSGGDYKLAINKNSSNKEAARAWIDWFVNESGYSQSQGGISPVIGAPFPETLKSFEELGVEYISNTPNFEQEGYVDLIDNESEVGLWQPNFKQRLIEAALGNRKESFDDIMSDLNSKWNKAREKIVK